MDEVEQLREHIQELEKELSEVLKIVLTHFWDLRTPLTPIKGFIRTLLDDEQEESYTREERRELYKILEENVDRLDHILKELTDVVLIKQSGPSNLWMNWEEVDVCKLIERVAAIQQKRTDMHTLVLDYEPKQIFVEADRERLERILHDLVSNAIRYSPNRGEIRITARLEPPSEEYPSGTLLMQIQDQGIGMTYGDVKKFGQYFITPQPLRVGGMDGGIGLYMVMYRIKAHHGVAWADSEGPDKGTTFSFRIPVKQPRTEEAEEEHPRRRRRGR